MYFNAAWRIILLSGPLACVLAIPEIASVLVNTVITSLDFNSIEAEQKIDSTSIKINKTTSDLVNENTKSESQRGIQKAVPYFSDPEDSDVKKKRNEELEKMGIHNHKLPSFSND